MQCLCWTMKIIDEVIRRWLTYVNHSIAYQNNDDDDFFFSAIYSYVDVRLSRFGVISILPSESACVKSHTVHGDPFQWNWMKRLFFFFLIFHNERQPLRLETLILLIILIWDFFGGNFSTKNNFRSMEIEWTCWLC